jgi:hypothetical protein
MTGVNQGVSQPDLQGYGTGYIVRAKLPVEGRVPMRQPDVISTADIEREPLKYMALALIHLRNQLQHLATKIASTTKPFDEYRPQTLAGDSELTMTLQPSYENTERVESIIITGPAGAVVLQLGNRIWNLTIPAAGILVIAPIRLELVRSDNRILTAQTPGQYGLELMGYVDERSA